MEVRSKKEARDMLWQRGELSWKLDPVQKELYNLYYNSKHKVQTWLLGRRNGKSFSLVVLAAEQCIRHPNSIVKFVSPTKTQVNQNIRPLFKKIFEDCPKDLLPEFKTKDYIYYFPNGSEIQLAGTENKHAERLRGGDSHLAIVDEARDCKELNNVVKDILLPTTLMTKGKIILASTPPREAEHDFIDFIQEAELRGSLIKKTSFQNPRITKEEINDMIEELGGPNSESVRRELMCEIIKDSTTSVIPEFNELLEKDIVKDWPRPPFFDSYEAMDLGGKDLTVVLFGYFDFRADKVILEDELVMDFSIPDNNLETLTKQILAKEKELWFNYLTNEIKKPYLRISDIDYIAIRELSHYSHKELNFIPAKKDNKDAALNNLRVMLNNKKIIIHPRCKTLLRHLNNVKWYSPNNKNTFARSPDNGHYDAVDALIYFIRHIIYSKNPYPAHYEMNMKDLYVVNKDKFINGGQGSQTEIFKKIFGIKSK
jgi:hypothetical protein